ncbi:MAG: hypothetical protein A2Y10_00950 [Planctomycetes bacterium GWF2_41_51]|nr:MAG: hypothetical protein A2Y10_00950 [Planctomycetes bacterium GWF2_41_51]HBG26512.1 sodium:proton exchanger [Phycisphaerales bacterium]
METALNTYLTIVIGFAFIFGMFSKAMKKIISPMFLAMMLGILVSPQALNLIPDLEKLPREIIFEQGARLTLAVGLMASAMRLTPSRLKMLWRPGLLLTFSAMFAMWFISSLLAHFVLGMDWVYSLLLGAIITPTDPILASSIVTGSFARANIDERIRILLSLESGANDGLAYLFVFVPITIIKFPMAGSFFHEWFFNVLLWEVLAGMGIAIAAGAVAGKLFRFAKDRKLDEEGGLLIYSICFSLVMLGSAKLIFTNEIWVVFIAGLTFNYFINEEERLEEEEMQDASNLLFNISLFFIFGFLLPWKEWFSVFGFELVMFAIMILFLRRIPAILLIYRFIPNIRVWYSALFMGWFGPIGVSGLFYAAMVFRKTGLYKIYLAAMFVIFVSVLAHGLTEVPFTKIYRNQIKKNQTLK